MLEDLRGAERDAVRVAAPPREVFLPTDLESACRFKADHPECLVVAGATDVAVRRNKGAAEPDAVLALSRRMAGFTDATLDGDRLRAGAGATWSSLLDLAGERVPELAKILELFGAPQIRNAATLGGNLANASPIARLAAVPLRRGRVLELRRRAARGACRSSRSTAATRSSTLLPGELIASVEIPLPRRERRSAALQDEPPAHARHRVVHRRDPGASRRVERDERAHRVRRRRARRSFACRAPKRSSPASRSRSTRMRRAGEIAASEITPMDRRARQRALPPPARRERAA